MSKPKTIQEIIEHWHQAARAENIDHRNGSQAAFAQCRQYLQSLSESLDVERARLRYVAQRFSDHFWAHNKAHRTPDTSGYPGHHGCRVRMLRGSLEMHWYYNVFVKRKSGHGHDVFSQHICREHKHRYAKSAFNRAQDWELPIIDETESGFEMVRTVNANLTQIRYQIRANLKQLNKLEAHLQSLQSPKT
ncbi:hypothetical protein J6I75_07295 [Pseudidiomarina sp. 1APP75-27a]|uniref:conjugative transfer protein MobI(A/C) n=1 Tax=Pseudidiomarina terrestris TaxID=2820060 RepID=UPI002B05CFE3|nr:conjugative transfer protein MobI(A/C) [Pseudidiomarina sp. 1APP75-27a]MEA3588155.1 hypothetical protein [Pseudidiomarina sp. 1APP75-27a]